MCDFKPGEEIVCINADYREHPRAHVRYATQGQVYRVLWMDESQTRPGTIRCGLEGLEWRFRKVQRRDLSAWLETATDFEEPTRAPKKERV